MLVFFNSLSISDQITLFGVIASVVFSCISASIAVASILQSNKAIREANRPYITIYGAYSHINNINYYLVIKNFGNIGAQITDFSASHDLKQLLKNQNDKAPFEGIIGTFLAPGQSVKTHIDIEVVPDELNNISFKLQYKSGRRSYIEKGHIAFEYTHSTQSHRVNARSGDELSIIAKILQDIDEQNL